MSEILISNQNQLRLIEPFIIEKLNKFGLGILDLRHPSFSEDEKYRILLSKYREEFIADALETGHFTRTENGSIRVSIRTLHQEISVIAGYIFEASTVRLANDSNRQFGRNLFKWGTGRKKLFEQYYHKYQTIGVGFHSTDVSFTGYYNPNFRQFDVMFLTMNEHGSNPEPATVINTTIPAGIQIKAITSNELTTIIKPLLRGQYSNVLTYLRHTTGEHSYEVCLREIIKLYNTGEITEDDRRRLEYSIGYPEKFGLDQRDIDDYYNFIREWYSRDVKEDDDILLGLGLQSQEIKYGNSFITLL